MTEFLRDDGNIRRLLAATLWKLKKNPGADYSKGVTLTEADLEEFLPLSDSGEMTLLVHGHRDSIEMRMVTYDEGLSVAVAHRGKGTAEYLHTPGNPNPQSGHSQTTREPIVGRETPPKSD